MPSASQQRAAAAERHRADLAERRRSDPLAARADQLRAAYAAAETPAGGQVPARELLTRLRARLGAPSGPRWRDPAEIAAEQAAESRAARLGAYGPG